MPVLRPGRDAVDGVVVRDEAVREREHAIAHVEGLRRRELRPLAEALLPDPSPPVKFKTLRSEVEVTGVQTADERDAEAKKRAVDVDADDEPEAKRAK